MTQEAADAAVERFANALAEHFDSVQIVASWHEEGRTRNAHHGCGNVYARAGLMREFVMRSDAEQQADMIAKEVARLIDPPDKFP